MKHAKKFAGLLLALVMAFAMSVTSFAAQEGELTGGSITIENPVKKQTYNVYQILYLESYNTTTNAYSYKANSAWEAWLKTQTDYVTVDAQGYVTWVEAEGESEAARVAEFAKLAQAQAATMTPDGSATCPEGSEAPITIGNLKLGYYLVDTTLGTLCSLDTTNPTVTMQEKNEAPTNVKTVEEDSTPDIYGDRNDANIGQRVNFKSTVTAGTGAENYVFHDEMSAGLTFDKVNSVTLNGNEISDDNYKVERLGGVSVCTFHVVFTEAFCNTLKTGDTIEIFYDAIVNAGAIVGGNGNPNDSWIEYGDKGHTTTTPPSTTTTYTWKMDVFKYAMDGETKKALSGAKFTLSENASGTPILKLSSNKEEKNVYHVATPGEISESIAVDEIETDTTGKFMIKGLDSGTYYLTETAAPEGYNKLTAPITIVIDAAGNVTVSGTSVNEVEVLNQSGTELPSTGGMGTTIFYVLGSILLVGAAVLLIAKKRMSSEK